MALIFASRDTINEVTIFFHDRLLRACRATKVRMISCYLFADLLVWFLNNFFIFLAAK